jgi:pilus assembly protein CpaC
VLEVTSKVTKLRLIVQDTQVVQLSRRIKIVDGHNPDVVRIDALSPSQIRVRAETAGVTRVKLIDEHDAVWDLEILVEVDTRELEAYLRELFPGAAIDVHGIKDAVVLRGWVTDPTHIPRIISVAETFATTVHNQLDVAGSSQIQLKVKVLEVQRSKLRELGFNFATTGQNYFVGSGPGGIAPLTAPLSLVPGTAPATAASSLTNSEFVFGVTGNSTVFQGFLNALQTEALAKVLAEPTLSMTNGRPASMLSGGQFPVLIPSGTLGTATVQYREFGVRLDAVAIALGNGRVRLDVSPEVSERDFSSGVSFDGLVVPGISTRKVNTQVEMRFGETLIIGGLINTRRTGTTQKIPFFGELPWVGAAFSKKTYDWSETELLVLVTPHLNAPLQPHQVPEYGPGQFTVDPVDRELYFDGLLEVPRVAPDCPDCPPQGGMHMLGPGAPYLPAPGTYETPQNGSGQPVVPEYTKAPGRKLDPALQPAAGEKADGQVVPAVGEARDGSRRRPLFPLNAAKESEATNTGLIGPGAAKP